MVDRRIQFLIIHVYIILFLKSWLNRLHPSWKTNINIPDDTFALCFCLAWCGVAPRCATSVCVFLRLIENSKEEKEMKLRWFSLFLILVSVFDSKVCCCWLLWKPKRLKWIAQKSSATATGMLFLPHIPQSSCWHHQHSEWTWNLSPLGNMVSFRGPIFRANTEAETSIASNKWFEWMNESFLLPLSRCSCSPCRQKRECVLEQLVSAGPWPADQRCFGIMKMEIRFGWFYHPYPSTFSSAVLRLLTSASFSSFTAQTRTEGLAFIPGIPKRPQGSWSCSRSPPGLWPLTLASADRCKGYLTFRKRERERAREGTDKKIGMRERMEGGGRITYHHSGHNIKGQGRLVPH